MNNLKKALESIENTNTVGIEPSYMVKQYILKKKDIVRGLLINKKSVDDFEKEALRAFRADERLADCDIKTFVSNMLVCEGLGVEVNNSSGEAFIVPREIDGKMVAYTILGYRGAIKMAFNSGVVKSIYAKEVRANDEFEIDYGIEQTLIHRPYLKGDRGEIVGYYGVCTMNSGYSTFEYMSKSEIEEYGKKYSLNYEGGYWENEFESMAKKTLIKKVLKYMPFVKYIDNISAGSKDILN